MRTADRSPEISAGIENHRALISQRPPADHAASILELELFQEWLHDLREDLLRVSNFNKARLFGARFHFNEELASIGDEPIRAKRMRHFKELRRSFAGAMNRRPTHSLLQERVDKPDFDQVLEAKRQAALDRLPLPVPERRLRTSRRARFVAVPAQPAADPPGRYPGESCGIADCVNAGAEPGRDSSNGAIKARIVALTQGVQGIYKSKGLGVYRVESDPGCKKSP